VATAPIATESTAPPPATPIADEPPAADRQFAEESPIEDESAADEPAPASAEVEKELLAGIEDFRNQLAQLKGGVTEQAHAAQPATA
jgi:hypothetical protein